MKISFIFIAILIPLFNNGLQSQANTKPSRFIGLSGNLQISGNTYAVKGIQARRSPFAFSINGSPTLSIWKIRIPFNFSYQQSQFDYSIANPYRRYGMTPTYKWVKLFLGWSNLDYSPYVLSGRSFFGGGFELKPGKLYLSGFYGTFENNLAFRDSSFLGIIELPTSKRNGFGFKIGYRTAKSFLGFSAVKIKDANDIGALNYSNNNLGLEPKENLALGLSFRFPIVKKLYMDMELGATLLSDDINSRGIDGIAKYRFIERTIFTPNISTYLSLGGDISLKYQLKRNSIGLKLSRIEPYYQTLSGSYFKNDVENLAINFSTYLARKISINLSGGVQRNNLLNILALTSRRIIGSLQANYVINEKWSVSGSYSNYQQSASNGAKVLVDSIRFGNITQNSNLLLRYAKKNSSFPYTIHLSVSRLKIDLETTSDVVPTMNTNLTTSLNGSCNLKSYKINIGAGIFYTRSDFSKLLQEQMGMNVFVSKQFGQKISANVNFNYYNKYVKLLRNGYAFRCGGTASYKLLKNHSVGFRTSFLNHYAILSSPFRELQASVVYNFNFAY